MLPGVGQVVAVHWMRRDFFSSSLFWLAVSICSPVRVVCLPVCPVIVLIKPRRHGSSPYTAEGPSEATCRAAVLWVGSNSGGVRVCSALFLAYLVLKHGIDVL